MAGNFTRTIEDFVCLHCGARVSGDGYTNHCPQCLWSRHVDVQPGDRASECCGMMEPVRVFQKHGEYFVQHRCIQCGHEKNNRTIKSDNFETLLAIVAKRSERSS
jgi:hypothetical protein